MVSRNDESKNWKRLLPMPAMALLLGVGLFAGSAFAGVPTNSLTGQGMASLQGGATATSACTVATYVSNDVPKAIPSSGIVTSTLTITGGSTIASLEVVGINIAHTSPTDLDVYLVSPSGTVVELFTDVCGNENWTAGNTGFTLSDGAASTIGNTCPPNQGAYRPEGSLATLAGQNSSGTWALVIVDDDNGQSGTLNGWGLRVMGAGCPTGTPSVVATGTTTMTGTPMMTRTVTATTTLTATGTATIRATGTVTSTGTAIMTGTAMATGTVRATGTATAMSTSTAMATGTVRATGTVGATGTAEATNTARVTNTVMATGTAGTATAMSTGTAMATNTVRTTGTVMATGTATAAGTGTAMATGTSRVTNTVVATATIPRRVGVCHRTGSERNPYVQIEISSNALPAHLRHGDIYPVPPGGCPGPGTPTPTMSITPEPTETMQPCAFQFSDVPRDQTFYANIRCLSCQTILGGYSDGTFRPNNFVTRGQLAKIVANGAGFLEDVSGQTFSDVMPSDTFYLFIERIAAKNIIGGYSDGTFRANNPATRGQIAKIVSNTAGFNDPANGQTFTDVPPTDTFYIYIERMAKREIIGGYADGTFRPNNLTTRGQVSKMVSNTFFPGCTPPEGR